MLCSRRNMNNQALAADYSYVLLLGHRGARATREIPENALESFELCLQHGCDGFEFDVRRTADGAAIICHDPASRGREIAASSAAELELPTLEDVIQEFSSRAFLDIELKVPGLERRVAASLREHPPKKGYVVSSFLPEVLTTLHELESGISLGFIYDRHRTSVSFPLDFVIPHHRLVTRELIEETHASGEKIITWTVNREADMRRFAEWGVDAIISGDTELLVRTLR